MRTDNDGREKRSNPDDEVAELVFDSYRQVWKSNQLTGIREMLRIYMKSDKD